MRKTGLIITADDFGRWPEVNDAVVAGHDNGVITSASLRVTATASSSAVTSAKLRPELGVGLYLVLCDGQATLPHRHIPNIVDSTGRFVAQPLEAAWLYRRRAGVRKELKAEIRAQLEKFLATGLTLSHVAGHYQLHLHPVVLSILLELAEEYPIYALRRSVGRLISQQQRRSIPWMSRSLETFMLRGMVARTGWKARSMLRPDRVVTLAPSRPATESEVVRFLGTVGSGVTELVCQPGSLSANYDGPGEGAVVRSEMVRKAIEDGGLRRISYRDLLESA